MGADVFINIVCLAFAAIIGSYLWRHRRALCH
jgi:hypothetical protein